MEELKFYQITDTHLYAQRLIGSEGEGYERFCQMDQKCLNESETIIDAFIEKMKNDDEVPIIVVTGDLTCNGEVPSNELIREKLQALKDAGKKVYTTFATHDFYFPSYEYNGSEKTELPRMTRPELREFYNDFGYSEAVDEHDGDYSYAVIPAPGIRFLMLNDDGDGQNFCGYTEEQIQWIETQAKDALEKGEKVIAFTHHPVIPPSVLYPIMSHRDMLGNYETVTPRLADAGIEFVFTGHTHMQSIEYMDTAKGSRLYHINTGSCIAYPAPIRKVTIGELGVDVKTEYISDFDWDKGGKTVEEYMKEHFCFMINDVFYSMENDIEHFKALAKGFSLSEKQVDTLKPIILLLGKVINNITFKQFGNLLFVGKYVDKSIADKKLKDFMLDLVCTTFSGVKKYPPKSSEYKAMMAAMKRLGKFIRLKGIGIDDIIEDLLYDKGDYDNTNAFLPY